MKIPLVLTILFLLFCSCLHAQEQAYYAKKYLTINLRSMERYERRIERQQKQLLQRLSRKEKKLARLLEQNDSAAYAAYKKQALSYDSIGRLMKQDSVTIPAAKSKLIDSLRSVQSFIQTAAPVTGSVV